MLCIAVRKCMEVHGSVWQCIEVHGSARVRKCMAVHGSVWQCSAMHGRVCQCKTVSAVNFLSRETRPDILVDSLLVYLPPLVAIRACVSTAGDRLEVDSLLVYLPPRGSQKLLMCLTPP